MRTSVLVGVALLALAAAGCGSSSTPAGPTPTTSGGGGGGTGVSTTIYILGGAGSDAFNPSSATVAQGSSVQWMNSDVVAHQVVAIDGSFDTGIVEPDQLSPVVVLTTDGARYYCAIHPTEVGNIKASGGGIPPCGGSSYC